MLAGLFALAGVAQAGPEEDRLGLVSQFKRAFPDIAFADYVHGAFVFDPDGLARHAVRMEFPLYTEALARGERFWKTPFRNGRTYADCLPDGGRMIAGNYPQFDEKKGRVVSFEDALNDCRVANDEPAYRLDDPATMGLLSAYARSLSDGMKMNVRVGSAAARKAFEAGKRLFYARQGQNDYACAHCHVDYAGYRWGGQTLSPVLGQAAHWPTFRAGNRLVTLQMRYAECLRLAQHVPDPAGSPRMNNLEYFHSYLSNGLPLRANALRDLAQ